MPLIKNFGALVIYVCFVRMFWCLGYICLFRHESIFLTKLNRDVWFTVVGRRPHGAETGHKSTTEGCRASIHASDRSGSVPSSIRNINIALYGSILLYTDTWMFPIFEVRAS